MLDPLLRPLIDPPLDRIATFLAQTKVTASGLTIGGFAVGLLVVPLLAMEHYPLALSVIVVNRLADGLDGAVARRTKVTDFGGYIDILFDMLFYAACVVGFALARQENLVPSIVLLASFIGTGSSFLAWAAIARSRGLTRTSHGRKSFYYSAGLIEGTETILFLIVVCVLPSIYAYAAFGFAALCGVTVVGRIGAARLAFSDRTSGSGG